MGITSTTGTSSLSSEKDTKRIAIVNTWTYNDLTSGETAGTVKIRYQYSNHLGSASLELNDVGEFVSYQEYFPFGETAYTYGTVSTEYRFTGKERDEFTGLYYFGARYYAPWMFRWMNPDPSGPVDGLNVFMYVSNRPIVMVDPDGRKQKHWVFTVPGHRRMMNAIMQGIIEQHYDYWGEGHPQSEMLNEHLDKYKDIYLKYTDDYSKKRNYTNRAQFAMSNRHIKKEERLQKAIKYSVDAAYDDLIAQFYSWLDNDVEHFLANPNGEQGIKDHTIDFVLFAMTPVFSKIGAAGKTAIYSQNTNNLNCTAFDDIWTYLDDVAARGGTSAYNGFVKTKNASFFSNWVPKAPKTKTFYTVQGADDAKRLMADGTPFPTEPLKAALGEGVYAWDNIESAQKYMEIWKKKDPSVSILKIRIDDDIFNSLKRVDIDDLADPDAFMEQYSKLWGGNPDHGYEFITREASESLGKENLFIKSIFQHLRISND